MSPVPATSAEIVASMRMATRSSAMRTLKTASRARFSKRRSWKAWDTIMVEEIDTSAPASRLVRVSRPKNAATWEPSAKVRPTSITATTPAGGDDAGQLAEVELEAEREHQQDDAELGEGADRLFVGEERDGGVRAHDDAGQQVAQHHRQAQLLARDGRERRGAQHEGQVLQEGVRTHQYRCRCM